MCHLYNINILLKSSSVFNQRMTDILSVIVTATSEAVSASHYVIINLQFIKFIVATGMWVLSFSFV